MTTEPFSAVMERALYGPDGFYQRPGGGAGRRRDFLTSPEVGPLFGAVLARALDRWWEELGRPDPFVVHDVGAGPGTLGRSVVRAAPACASALDYVLVDRAGGSADARTGTGLRTATALPSTLGVGVVVANELLDNLPFDIAVRAEGRWMLVHVEAGAEVLVPADEATVALLGRVLPEPADGVHVPVAGAARRWLADALDGLERGRIVVIDYGASTPELAGRPARGWLRTYADHRPGADPLLARGAQDITADVPFDQLVDVRAPDLRRTQAEALVAWGLDALVDEGRRRWEAGRHAPDLAAMEGRSRIGEADALTDRTGLGAFQVLEWVV